MNKRLVVVLYFICTCLTLTQCKSQDASAVQIVFFDLNNFDKTDTILINNIDTIISIRALFSNMKVADAKFPRRYQITIYGKGFTEMYYSNGSYVRNNRKSFVLPEGKELVLFESILRSRDKKDTHP
jgi:hypothetical protein